MIMIGRGSGPDHILNIRKVYSRKSRRASYLMLKNFVKAR